MKTSCFTVLFVMLSLSVLAQSAGNRVRMERERQAIKKELRVIQTAYTQVKGRKKETLGQLALLERKMTVQSRYIGNIHSEIRILSSEIDRSNGEISRLQQELDTLKAQFGRSVVYAYKNRSTYDYLNFLFSAASFNDALKRISYLQSYRAFRQQQVANIVQTQEAITAKKEELLGKKSEKGSALQNKKEQLRELAGQKREKDRVVERLKSEEAALQKKIASRKKRDAQLRNAIAGIIRREMAAARKAALAKAAAEKKRKAPGTAASGSKGATTGRSTGSVLVSTRRDIALNAGFENNRGRLPWPVDNGHVSVPFGRSKWGGMEMDNPSLTIATPSAGAAVKAVFEGEVSSVANLGDGLMVVIKHGKYFTVYSNLSSMGVRKGQTVRTGQVLGRTGTADEGGGGQLEFMIIIETRNVNPQPWLRR